MALLGLAASLGLSFCYQDPQAGTSSTLRLSTTKQGQRGLSRSDGRDRGLPDFAPCYPGGKFSFGDLLFTISLETNIPLRNSNSPQIGEGLYRLPYAGLETRADEGTQVCLGLCGHFRRSSGVLSQLPG
jgi:hypothetical protein